MKKYKITFKYRYGIDYVYCDEYKADDNFIQPLKEDGHPLCTISKTNIVSIKTNN